MTTQGRAVAKRTRRTQSERREEAEQRMLEAATALIAERGFGRFVLGDVGTRAGYSATLPVHYFGTKEDLLVATARHVISTYDVVLRGKLGDADGTRAMRIILRSYLQQALEHPTERRALAIILAEAATNPLLQAGIAALTRRGAQEFAKFIRQAQARAEVAVDVNAERVGMVMIASLRGLVALWLVDPTIDLRSLGEQLEASLMKSLESRV